MESKKKFGANLPLAERLAKRMRDAREGMYKKAVKSLRGGSSNRDRAGR